VVPKSVLGYATYAELQRCIVLRQLWFIWGSRLLLCRDRLSTGFVISYIWHVGNLTMHIWI